VRKSLLAVVWFAAWFMIGYATGLGRVIFGWAWALLD